MSKASYLASSSKRHFDEKTEAVYTSFFFFFQIAIFLKQVFVFIKFKKKGGT